MPEWVEFKGKVEEIADGYRLTASEGGGVIEVPKHGASLEGAKVKLKIGEKVKIVRHVQLKRPASERLPPGCRQTQCIGLVLICCDNGQVISGCVGYWGCS
jgi:hypothetical protein